MREPLLTPDEEWMDFKSKTLDHQALSAESIQTLRLAFLSGLTAATGFFQNLFSEEYSKDERKFAYDAWNQGLHTEVSEIEGILLQDMMRETNGRDN